MDIFNFISIFLQNHKSKKHVNICFVEKAILHFSS